MQNQQGNLLSRLSAELLGTYAIVFFGTGAIIVNGVSDGVLTHSGICLVFGLIVLAMIYSFGDVSGAHFNPAVTLAFTFARRFEQKDIIPYVLAQVTGALAASSTLRFLFPESITMGQTLPSGTPSQSFILELILSFFLMLVVLNVSSGAKEKGITAGLAIASTVWLEAEFAGPICGASMNPVRSLAPAIVAGTYQHLWLYLIAPVLGTLLAVLILRLIRSK